MLFIFGDLLLGECLFQQLHIKTWVYLACYSEDTPLFSPVSLVSESTVPGYSTSNMKARTLLVLVLLANLSFALAQDESNPPGTGKKRRGQKRGRGRQQKQRPSDTPVLLGNVPVVKGEDDLTIFIDSYKGVNEFETNYNVVPGQYAVHL